jgi:hypothetical protein
MVHLPDLACHALWCCIGCSWVVFALIYAKTLPKHMYWQLFCTNSGPHAALDPCDNLPDLLRRPMVLDVGPSTKVDWELAVDPWAVHNKQGDGPFKRVVERAQLVTDFPSPFNQVVLRAPMRK